MTKFIHRLFIVFVLLFSLLLIGCGNNAQEVNNYKVNIHLEGGQGCPSEIEIKEGDEFSFATPTKVGYNFIGWFLEDGSLLSTSFNYSNDIDIYAKWEAKSYEVTLDSNGGTDITESKIIIKYDDTLTLPQVQKDGYTFEGWYNGDELVENGKWNTDNNISLVAKWTVKSFTITNGDNYKADDNRYNAPFVINTKYGEEFTLPTLEATGYTFLGWYNGNEKVVSGIYNYIDNIVVNSKWEANTYTITLDVNGGLALDNNTLTVTYGEEFTLPSASKTGYKFLGWYEGDTKYEESGIWNIDNNVTLQAKWDGNFYKINLDVNGGNALSSNSINAKYGSSFSLPTPKKTGYSFLGWYKGEEKIENGKYNYSENISLIAKWQVNNYEITLDVNGGTTLDQNKINVTYEATFTLPTVTRQGYTFSGWYNVNTKVEAGIWQIGSNVTLVAKWDANNYKISLDVNGGNALTNNTLNVPYDSNFTLPTPTKTGYTFLGWFKGEELVVNGKYYYLDNLSLTAKWKANNYELTLDVNGGSVLDQTKINVTYDASFTLPTVTRQGYTLNGWYNGNTKVEAGTWKFEENITLKAKWDIINYDIKYYDGEDLILDFDNNLYSFNIESDNFALPVYVKEGYVFRGWYLNKDLSCNSITNIDASNLEELVVYAKLEVEVIKNVNLTLELNDGYWFNYDLETISTLRNMFKNDATITGEQFVSQYGDKAAVVAFLTKTSVLGKDIYKWDFLLDFFNNVNTNDNMQYFFTYYLANHAVPSTQVATLAGFSDPFDNYYLSYDAYLWYVASGTSKTNTNGGRNIISAGNVYDTLTLDTLINYLVSNQLNTFVIKGDTTLPIPFRNGYKFNGWYLDNEFSGEAITIYPKNVDEVKDVTLYAKWDKADYNKSLVHSTFESLTTYFESLGQISADINLPLTNDTYKTTISWETSDKDALSKDGKYITPNKDVTVTLTATVEYDGYSEEASFDVSVKRFYSDLTNGLTAGYVYKGEMATMSDYTIENLDIVYIAFAYPRDDGSVDVSSIKSYLNDFVTRCHSYGTYVVLSLQEHEDANAQNKDAFSIISASAEMRTIFNDNLIDIINTYHLDGIDMDWEHPDEGEEEQYTELMKDLYNAIKANNKYHLLTTATSGADKYTRFNLTESIKYIDYINLMTYDLHSSSRSQFTSALVRGGSSKNYKGIDGTYTNYVTTLHMPTNKLVLGIAFYGLIYHETDGIYTSAPKELTEKKAYSYIYDNYISKVNGTTITKTWEDTAKCYYVYDSENRICATYDDPESIAYKIQQAYDWGFAGAMYWRDGQDRGDELVKAMVDKVNECYNN